MIITDTSVGISIEGWRLTPHGRERITEMGLDDETVLEALRHPDMTYPGSTQDHHQSTSGRERTCAVHGNIMVVVCGTRVITVLWHLKDAR